MREIDEVHHAEHQRQAGGDEKQDQPELQAVQHLDEKQRGGHGRGCPFPMREGRPDGPRATAVGKPSSTSRRAGRPQFVAAHSFA